MFPLTAVHLKTPQNLIGWDVKPNQNPCERPQTDALLPRNSSFGLSRVSGAVSGRTQTDKNSQKSSSQPWRRCQSLRGCCKGKCAHTRASSCVKKQLRSQTYKKHQNVAPSARIARCNIPFPDALTKRRRQPVIETVAKSAVEKNQQTFLSFVEETQMAQCGFYRLSQQQQQKESPQNIPLCVTTLFWVLVNFGKLRYPPPYLISTLVSVSLDLPSDLSSSISWTFLATFGLELAFLLIWGLCPLRCICGLLEPSFRLSSGLLEPFALGGCRLSRVLSGTSPRSPQ